MRVYLPATLGSLASLLTDGALTVDEATAVTAGLRAALPGTTDEEDLELEAFLDAAELSLALVAADASVPQQRVVLAADVPGASVEPAPDRGPAVVRLTGPVPLSAVVSAHVDEPAAQAQVAAGETDDVDLLWYAPAELSTLLPPPTPS